MDKRYLYQGTTILSFEFFYEIGYIIVYDGNTVIDKISETTHDIKMFIDVTTRDGELIEIDPLKPLQAINKKIEL